MAGNEGLNPKPIVGEILQRTATRYQMLLDQADRLFGEEDFGGSNRSVMDAARVAAGLIGAVMQEGVDRSGFSAEMLGQITAYSAKASRCIDTRDYHGTRLIFDYVDPEENIKDGLQELIDVFTPKAE